MAKALIFGLFAAVTVLGVEAPVVAAPMPVAKVMESMESTSFEAVRIRYRTRYRYARRNNGVPAAILGVFGAIAGAASANDRYDNYSNYSYGYPNGYGYDPGYLRSPGYGYYRRGGEYRGYRGNRW